MTAIEAGNRFEGRGECRDVRCPSGHWPKLRNPFTRPWGAVPPSRTGGSRCHRARSGGVSCGLCLSHQPAIWTLRRFVTGQRLWHDPRRRQCALASLTSLVFTDAQLTQLRYSEPAGFSNPTQTGA